jgi:GGDEF domain-containing protein
VTGILESLRQKLISSSTQNENGQTGYLRSISYGIVNVEHDNTMYISDILALADDRMYDYKKAHKKERRI